VTRSKDTTTRLSTALLALALALGATGCGGSSQTPTPTPGSDATLVALVLGNGTLSPAFASTTAQYEATAPYGTATVVVTPIARDAGATLELRQDGGAPEVIASGAASRPLSVPTVGATSTVTVKVTAADGTTTRTYTLLLSQANPADARIASLALSAGTLTPAFASGTERYAATVPYGTATVTVTATSPSGTLAVSQDGGPEAPLTSGTPSAPLTVPAPGKTSAVAVKVTPAALGTTRTYTIVLTQATAPSSSDATLASLGVSAGALSPAFAGSTDRYTLTVPFATDTVKLQPTATRADARSVTVALDGGAAVTVASGAWTNALSVPLLGRTSTIVVTVTAADGVTTGTYQVTLARADANDATLKALTESAGRLTAFAPGTLRYDLTVPYQPGTYTVTPTANDPLATITVNGTAVASGAAAAVALVVGANTVNVDVTSQDRTSSTRYVLNVTEEASLPPPVAGLVSARTVPLAASSLPTVAAGVMSPSGATGAVPVDTLLRIGFDAAPTLGARGTIKIFRSDGTLADVIDLADGPAHGALTTASLKLRTAPPYMSTMVNVLGGTAAETPSVRFVYYAPIAISGNTVTIFPHANRLTWDGTSFGVAKTLEYGAAYYVTIDDGVLNGSIGGVAFTGISDPTAWTFTTRASRPTGTILRVSWDGTADFATVQGALEVVPPGSSAAYTVEVAPGVYQELLFAANRKNLTIRGTSGNAGVDTIVQYDNCEDFNHGVGASTAWTAFAGGSITLDANGNSGGRAVFLVEKGDRIALDGITLKNTHAKGSTSLPTVPTRATGAGNTQAETLYFNVSTAALAARRSNFVSSQDTLQLKGYTLFYDCFVAGDVDFIWGYPYVSLFERSELRSRSAGWLVQSRAYQDYPGFVFLQSRITQEAGFSGGFLARSSTNGTTPSTAYSYDNVAFVRSVFDAQLASGAWDQSPNTTSTPAAGWRQYGNTTAAGQVVTTYRAGSLSLTDGQAAMFFADRQTIFTGATDGTSTSKGLGAAGWSSYAPFFSP
jgi:hypothetical protein